MTFDLHMHEGRTEAQHGQVHYELMNISETRNHKYKSGKSSMPKIMMDSGKFVMKTSD